MRAKKTRQPEKGVRYLLSADRKFRRLSLKKISQRVKTAGGRTRERTISKSATTRTARAKAAPRSTPTGAAPIVFGLVAIVSLAALVGARQASSRAESDVTAAQAGDVAVLAADVATPSVVTAKKPAPAPEATRSKVASVSEPRTAERAAIVSAPQRAPAPVPVEPRTAPRPAEATVARAEPPAKSAAPAPAPSSAQPVVKAESADTVTLSGCLEYDGESAWLKNVSGDDAPKARSWRSGFLRKRTPRIALVSGPASRAAAYDGQQVSVTGVLEDREMRVSSLSRIANSCD